MVAGRKLAEKYPDDQRPYHEIKNWFNKEIQSKLCHLRKTVQDVWKCLGTMICEGGGTSLETPGD